MSCSKMSGQGPVRTASGQRASVGAAPSGSLGSLSRRRGWRDLDARLLAVVGRLTERDRLVCRRRSGCVPGSGQSGPEPEDRVELAGRDHHQVIDDRDYGPEAGASDGSSTAALSERGLAVAVVAITDEHESHRSTGCCNGQDGGVTLAPERWSFGG